MSWLEVWRSKAVGRGGKRKILSLESLQDSVKNLYSLFIWKLNMANLAALIKIMQWLVQIIRSVLLSGKYLGTNVAGQSIASITMCVSTFGFYHSLGQSLSLLWHTADFLEMQEFQLTLIASVAMLPPCNTFVGGDQVSHNCSVDRKAEA